MSKTSTFPRLSDIGVIGLVPDFWGGAWQPRHHVMTRLSKYFSVVWLNPAPSWRKLWRPNTPRGNGIDYGSAVTSGLTIYYPEKWLPRVGRPRFLSDWTMRKRLLRAERMLLSRGCSRIILYIWRPDYEQALDFVRHDLSCYHIDDEYTFSDVEKATSEREVRLISRVDQVFIHSPALLEKKGHLNPQTAFVPNGVDYQAYTRPHNEPPDLKPIPHPRIGYVGIIKKQLDIALLITLAERHRDWSFVMVGPQNSLGEAALLIEQLSHLPNVHFLGGKPVGELPAYVQHLDVCMLCYVDSGYTKFIYPMKLHEYLASGRPVVGTPIRSLQDYAHVVKLARTPGEWSNALADALASASYSADETEYRRSVARQYDWNRLVSFIAHTLCERLGNRYLNRFKRFQGTDDYLSQSISMLRLVDCKRVITR